jgi:uridine phosphorylase
MLPQYHLKLKPGDVAPYVRLPGDPKRLTQVGCEVVRILFEQDQAKEK